MVSFSSPFWLLGLISLVAIWWLHRSGMRRELSVSAVFLWRDAATPSTGENVQRQAPPIWLLRAAVVTMLLLALAGLTILSRPGRIVIWFDDSASMATLEQGMSRSALAVDRILEETGNAEVVIRSLSDHGLEFVPDSPVQAKRWIAEWTSAERSPRPPVHVDDRTRHWLVTDGSDADVNAGAQTFDRVFRVGEASANVGITHLALRRSLSAPTMLLGLVRVENASSSPARRTITITADGKPLLHREVSLAVATNELTFTVDRDVTDVSATIEPGDHLAIDDHMTLPASPMAPLRVHVAGDCERTLVRAIAAHPAMEITEGVGPTLTLACGDALSRVSPPAIRWFGSATHDVREAWLQWATEDADPFRYPVSTRPSRPASSSSRVLLQSLDGASPLVVDEGGNIDVYLNIAPPPVPATMTLTLLGRIFDAAAGRALLDPIVSHSREIDEIRITPLATPVPETTRPTSPKGRDLAALLALAALVLILFEFAALAARDRAFDRQMSWRGAATAAVLIALLVALVNPQLPWSDDILPIVLIDVSDSMGPEPDRAGWRRVIERVEATTRTDRYDTFVFAGDVRPVTNPPGANPPAPAIDSGATNIEAAVTAAVTGGAGGQPIVMFTDGIETIGNAAPALEFARRRGQSVFVLGPDRAGRSAGEPHISGVAIPREVRPGSRFTATIRIDGTRTADRMLEVFAGGRITASRSVRVTRGVTAHPVELGADTTGPLHLTFRLRGDDRDYHTVVNVRGKTPLLYVSADSARPMAVALRFGGWPVSHWHPDRLASAIPPDIGAIILDDVAVQDAPDVAWRFLSEAVRRGAGLIILGGDNSFGAGGYRGSRLEALSPVTAQSGSPARPISVVFLLDRSGSMDRTASGANRFARAREAILQTARMMNDDARSEIGVVTFDTRASVLLPLDRYRRPERAIENALRDDSANGGTLLASGLRLAARELQDAVNERRVLVVVTDGFAADEEFDDALELIDESNVEVMALAVGADADVARLRRLVDHGRGKLLRVTDVMQVPAFVAPALDDERPVRQQPGASPRVTWPLPFLQEQNEWPTLDAYMVTRARDDADVFLTSARGDPLLASWQYGLGRVIAIPGSVDGFANGWTEWQGWGDFTGGLVEWAAGSPATTNARIGMSGNDGEAREITVDLIGPDGDWQRGAPAVLTAAFGPASGPSSSFAIPRIAPGRYRTSFRPARTGIYRLSTQLPGTHVLTDFYYRARSEHDTRASSLDRWLDAGLVRPATDFEATASTGARNTFLALALVLYSVSLVMLLPASRKPQNANDPEK